MCLKDEIDVDRLQIAGCLSFKLFTITAINLFLLSG